MPEEHAVGTDRVQLAKATLDNTTQYTPEWHDAYAAWANAKADATPNPDTSNAWRVDAAYHSGVAVGMCRTKRCQNVTGTRGAPGDPCWCNYGPGGMDADHHDFCRIARQTIRELM